MAEVPLITAACLVIALTNLAAGVTPQYPHIPENNVDPMCINFTWGMEERLLSPNYPDSYPTSVDCRKILRAGSDFIISLTFEEFELEDSDQCKYDFLEIRDGPYGFSPLLLYRCGSGKQRDVISSGQYMWLRFFSDGHITKQGFSIKITATPKKGSIRVYDQSAPKYDGTECYSVLEGLGRLVLTQYDLPNNMLQYYNDHPLSRVDCVWDIRTPPNTKILLRVDLYNTSDLMDECEINSLELYDVSTATSDLRQRVCRRPRVAWLSGSNRAILHLHANIMKAIPIFKITMNIYMKESNCSGINAFGCFDGYCIPSDLACNGELNCREGYDEDCEPAEKGETFLNAKYMILFIVVVSGTLLFLVGMTLFEAWLKRRHSAITRYPTIKKTRRRLNANSVTLDNALFPSRVSDNFTLRKKAYTSIHSSESKEPSREEQGLLPDEMVTYVSNL